MGARSLTAALLGATLVAAALPVAVGAAGATPPQVAGPIKRAVRAGAEAVLIVHVDGTRSTLQAAIARADTTSGVTIRHRLERTGSFSVRVPVSNESTSIAKLDALPGVTTVERSVARHFFDATSPDDPRLTQQQTYLDAVNAPQAWATQKGSSTVRIAVLDSGIDVDHPDLAAKIVGTYDADNGGTQITDELGHGTFVAGVAAAATDNGVGVAGAGYDSSILGVKIAAPDGSLPIDDEVAGIHWAVNHGADVINLSLGGPDYSPSERTAVEWAIGKGVLVVAAAGNDGTSVRQYPAAYPGVVAVGASDPATTTRASFSSYGPWVTLSAPGVGIYSTVPRAGSDYFATTSGYTRADGTSFSSPLVAGEAALLKAQSPGLSVSGLRAVLVASTHGYRHAGIGAGQVDFASALAHLAPSTQPSSATESGQSDLITLGAQSSAPKVAFALDADAYSAPVPVTNGAATLDVGSWGLPNGTHTLHVVDCGAYGDCASTATSVDFSLTNTAPTVSSPAQGTTSSGLFTVTASHPGGGGVRLLVDGQSAGFASGSPYSFAVNGSALSDGAHALTVELCSTGGSRCQGPVSTPDRTIDTESLHPSITSVSPTAISPNGDRVRDSARVSFSVPDPEAALGEAIDSTGAVLATTDLGTRGTGQHLWTWRGLGDDGSRLPDGRYTLAIVTSTDAAGVERHGYAATTAVLDTRAPTLTGITGNATHLYPVHDGYHDTFSPGVVLDGSGHLTLTVTDARHRTVRTLSGYRHAGSTSLTWNGRTVRGRIVPAGAYTWRYAVTDAAGNTRRSPVHHVTVSAKRLVTQRVALRRHGNHSTYAIGTDPTCSSAKKGRSSFRSGILLVNGCAPSHADLAFASYTFTAPKAIVYRKLALSVFGHSTHRPSELTAALQRTDGGLEIPRYKKINRRGDHWFAVTAAAATGHITRSGRIYLSVILDSSYPGRNDFDLKWARLYVTLTRLR